MSEMEPNNTATPAPKASAPGIIQRLGGKWVVASLAVVTLGAGMAVADWSRSGGEGGHGYGHGWFKRHHEARGPKLERMCERDPLRFEGVARAYLKADLDLNATQNAELDKLAAQLIPTLKSVRDEMCNNFAAGKDAPVPDRLERLSQVLRKAADAAQAAVPPTRSFYATLDEKQKARVEEMAARRPHGFGPGMGPRGPGGPGMGPGGPGMGPGGMGPGGMGPGGMGPGGPGMMGR